MKLLKFMLLSVFYLATTSNVFAENFRATELNQSTIKEILERKGNDHTVEFRKGDLIPLNFEAVGDLFESNENSDNTLVIKNSFFLKITENAVLISLEGKKYKPIKDLIDGTFTVSSDINGQVPGLIKILLAVYIR